MEAQISSESAAGRALVSQEQSGRIAEEAQTARSRRPEPGAAESISHAGERQTWREREREG